MLEIIKAVANAMLVSQGTNVGLKVINQKAVTDKEVSGLIIAILAVAILNSDTK
jgi:hypothetical protein